MPIALHSFLIDPHGKIRMAHVFYADDEDAARVLLLEHAQACPKFGPAYRGKETIEIIEEIDAYPEAEEDELADFLDLDEEEEEGEEEEGEEAEGSR
ncbi:MAG: hypothetical protein ACREVZ_00330 [Burkholderiales bacterium]